MTIERDSISGRYLSDTAELVIRRAYALATESTYSNVTPSILFVALVRESKDVVRFLLDQVGADYNAFCLKVGETLRTERHTETSQPSFSNECYAVIEKAKRYALHCNHGVVTPAILLWGLFSANNKLSPIFREFRVTEDLMRQAVREYMSGSSTMTRDSQRESSLDNLKKYALNMCELAAEGVIEPVVGRDEEIRRILQILSRKTKNNPLLLGEPGTGKTAIIEGLAHRLNRGDVPDDLKQLQIYSLNVSSLIDGASVQGEFESRLNSVIAEIKQAVNVVVFIDEIHLLMGAGRGSGALDAANILKPELARGAIKVIGATTYDEYNKFLESDSAFIRRFQRVYIDEPSVNDAITILRGIKSRFEAHHRIRILDEAVKAAVTLSSKYITDRFLPDKAIDILDETASRMRLVRSSVPAELDDLNRQIVFMEVERETLLQENYTTERVSALSSEILQLKEQKNLLNAKWLNERRQFESIQRRQDDIERLRRQREQAEISARYDEIARLDGEIESLQAEMAAMIDDMETSDSHLLKLAVDEEEVKETITLATGIPISSLSIDDVRSLSGIESALSNNVKGQPEAIRRVCNVIKRSRLGLGNEDAPIGSFLFMGTTGVGKTELAKTLAEYLFGSKKSLIRLDMSEYQQEYSVSRLFGAPPGYIGFDQGGQLTEAVRRKPYSVILLDEIEKAHPKICETLLQVLDDGRMTDGKGRTIDFKNTVIIMTSNLGADVIAQTEDKQSVELSRLLTDLLKRRTSPEFINRINDIVIFNTLSSDVLSTIATKLMIEYIDKLREKGLEITVSDDAICHIVQCSDINMGARPIKHEIERAIVDGVINRLLDASIQRDKAIYVDFVDGTYLYTNINEPCL